MTPVSDKYITFPVTASQKATMCFATFKAAVVGNFQYALAVTLYSYYIDAGE